MRGNHRQWGRTEPELPVKTTEAERSRLAMVSLVPVDGSRQIFDVFDDPDRFIGQVRTCQRGMQCRSDRSGEFETVAWEWNPDVDPRNSLGILELLRRAGASTTLETIRTTSGSRVVITDNRNTAGEYQSRLYVNHGETATLQHASHKTRGGAIRWAKRTLARHEQKAG